MSLEIPRSPRQISSTQNLVFWKLSRRYIAHNCKNLKDFKSPLKGFQFPSSTIYPTGHLKSFQMWDFDVTYLRENVFLSILKKDFSFPLVACSLESDIWTRGKITSMFVGKGVWNVPILSACSMVALLSEILFCWINSNIHS